jgi:hypothetical protein
LFKSRIRWVMKWLMRVEGGEFRFLWGKWNLGRVQEWWDRIGTRFSIGIGNKEGRALFPTQNLWATRSIFLALLGPVNYTGWGTYHLAGSSQLQFLAHFFLPPAIHDSSLLPEIPLHWYLALA